MVSQKILFALCSTVIVMTCCWSASSSGHLQELAADLEGSWQQQVQAAVQHGAVQDLRLRCESALEGKDLELVLRRRGDRWLALRPALGQQRLIQNTDLSQLTWQPGQVSGQVDIEWIDDAREGTGGLAWEHTGGVVSQQRRQLQMQLAITWQADQQRLTITIPGVIKEKDLILNLEHNGTKWTSARAAAPQWNRGLHHIDAGALNLLDGKLSGVVKLVMQPDAWIPADKKPRPVALHLNAHISGQGAVSGTFTTTGAFGKHEGSFNGSKEQILVGRHQVALDGVKAFGRVSGSIVYPQQPVLKAVTSKGAYFKRIAALQRALRNDPYDVADYEARQRCVIPNDEKAWSAAVAPYVSAKAQSAKVHYGVVRPANARFGPYAKTATFRTGLTAEDAETADYKQWSAPDAWHLLGPFVDPELDADPLLPEAVVMAEQEYEVKDFADHGAGQLQAKLTSQFQILNGPTDSGPHYNKSMMPEVWYGKTIVPMSAAQTVWCAIRADDAGRLWCNGRLVWVSHRPEQHYRQEQFALFRLDLQAGANEILVRCVNRFEATRVEFFIYAGDDAAATESVQQADVFTGGPRYPDADPPLAFAQDSGTNLAWTTQLPTGYGDPVVHGEQVFVTAGSNALHCLQLTDGKELWRVVCGPAAEDRQVSTTPVIGDGVVYARFPNGLVACSSLSGELRWEFDTGLTAGQGRAQPEPVLAKDLLIVQGYKQRADDKRSLDAVLCAVHLSSGKEAWRLDPVPVRPHRVIRLNAKNDIERYHDGTGKTVNGWSLVHLSADRSVLVSSHGHVVDVADGALLHPALDLGVMSRSAPLVSGQTVVMSGNVASTAMELWMTDSGDCARRCLWHRRRRIYLQPPEDTYYSRTYWHRSGVAMDGLLYVQRTMWHHWPKHHPKPYCEVSTYDRSGDLVGRQSKTIFKATNPSGSPIQAGSHLLFSDAGDGKYDGVVDHGRLVFALPGKTPLPFVESKVPRFAGTPVCAGGNLLLRTTDAVVCFRRQGDAGRQFEWQQVADYILDRLPALPKQVPVVESRAEDKDYFANDAVPVTVLIPKVMPDKWLMLGPMAAGDERLQAAAAGESSFAFKAGTAVGDQQVQVVARDHLQVSFGNIVYWNNQPTENFTLLHYNAIGKKKKSRSYFAAMLYSNTDRVLRLRVKNVGPTKWTFWCGGQQLKADQLIRLPVGFHRFIMRADIGMLPPFVKQMNVKVHFEEVKDPLQDRDAWYGAVQPYASLLQRLAKELPDTPAAGRAQIILRALGSREQK